MAAVLDDSAVGGDTASQRRSGRVVRAPAKFQPEIAPPSKRKRKAVNGTDGDNEADLNNNELEDEEADDSDAGDDDEDDDNDDDDSDHSEASPRRARPKRKANGASAKRAIKKPKLNGLGNVAGLPSRPKKSVRVAIATDDHDSALYGEL